MLKIKFSKREISDFLYSIIFISIIFTLALKKSISFFVVSFLIVGLSFLLHELAHKITAQYYGFYAEYYADKKNLFWPMLFAFFGLVLVAPGFVRVKGYIQKRENGIISLAGPLTNIILAILFYLLPNMILFGYDIFKFGYIINSTLAIFNMIPIANFDGKKILEYDKRIFYIMLGISFILYFF